MGLFKDSKLITDPLADNNPITIQVLGICSALAITAELEASIVMSIAVLFVLGVGNVVISLMRNIIPSKIRIIVQLVKKYAHANLLPTVLLWGVLKLLPWQTEPGVLSWMELGMQQVTVLF